MRRLNEALALLPDSLGFKIFDAYRPLSLQQFFFDRECARVRAVNPDLTDEEIRKIVFVSVYPPNTNPQAPPPHSTGGALDLSLMDRNGIELDMGCRYCDFGDRMYTNSEAITPEQRQNRLILLNAMVSAGFANFPGEWWHFMYGEREWAAYMSMICGKPVNSRYGRTKTTMR